MITLVNGNIQTPGGLIVPNGSITLQLNVDGTVIAPPGGLVMATEVVVFQFDANGQIQANAQIYSNRELQPQNSLGLGTYYLVTFYDANGARINKTPMWWQFAENTGATIDLGTMTPYAVLGGNVIFYPIPAGSVPAGGPDQAIQSNSGGNLYGDGNFLYDHAVKKVTLTGSMAITASAVGVTPLTLTQFSTGQTAPLLVVNNNSSLSPATPVFFGGATGLSLASIVEIAQGHDSSQSGLILTNQFAPGNTGSARPSYTTFIAADNGAFGIGTVVSGVVAEGALNFNADGSVDIGTSNTDGSITEMVTVTDSATAGIEFFVKNIVRVTMGSTLQVFSPLTLGDPVHSFAGTLTFRGLTSGSAAIDVAAVAGTPNTMLLPTATAGALGVLQSDGNNPQQLSWSGITGSGNVVRAISPTFTGTVNVAALIASGLITAQANIQLGVVGVTGGQITLEGATSGACTITAPAVAGTTTNPIVFSNAIQAVDFVSPTANPAQSGIVRLANLDAIAWRNAGNSADLALSVDATNTLNFGGSFNLTPTTALFSVNAFAVAAPILIQQAAAAITNTVLTSNVATYTAVNNFIAGQLVTVTGCAATYNVTTQKIQSATPTQFTVNITSANIGSAAASGSAWVPQMDIRSAATTLSTVPIWMVSDNAGNPLMYIAETVTAGTPSGRTQFNLSSPNSGQGATLNFITPAGGGVATVSQNGLNYFAFGLGNGLGVINAGGVDIITSIAGQRPFTFFTGNNQAAFDMAQFTGTARSAPGAGYGRLEWQTGTVGGLKLIGFAGASTVASTIADNVGNGRNQTVASVAYVDLTAQTATINTTTLYAVPAAGAGQYRLTWDAKVMTAAGVSSTLGPLTVTYVDPDGVTQTITCAAQSKTGTIETSDTGNSTTTVLLGIPILINSASSQNITYAFTYASNAAAAMNYNLHIRLESM